MHSVPFAMLALTAASGQRCPVFTSMNTVTPKEVGHVTDQMLQLPGRVKRCVCRGDEGFTDTGTSTGYRLG